MLYMSQYSMADKKAIRIRAALIVFVFAAMLLFFTVLHPIPIMDEDDVIYTVLSRKAIPIPGAWNPSRMMPEILSCVCGNLAGVFAALGFGSFIDCQVFVLGMMLSAFIAVYALSVIDAYVDAELSNFDISPDLSMRVEPAVMDNGLLNGKGLNNQSVGVQCSLKF